MNLCGSLLVAARGSAFPVSDRKHGSANGNRTCQRPVQFGSVESKCLSLRSGCTQPMAQMALRTLDVAARWQRGRQILESEVA